MAKNSKKKQMHSDMLNETIELFNNRPLPLRTKVISKETGLGLAWLNSLVANYSKGKHQSIQRIETLRNYLISKKGSK